MKTIKNLLLYLAIVAFFQSCTQVDHAPKPTVDFTVNRESEGKVSFNLTTSNTNSYLWDFGDGESSSEKSPTHTYKRNGKYMVTITVTGNEGQVSAKKEIAVTNITGSISIFSWNYEGSDADVFVDGNKIGTTVTGFRVIPPACGQEGTITAYNLAEGVHTYEIRNHKPTNPRNLKGKLTVIGGQCTLHGFALYF